MEGRLVLKCGSWQRMGRPLRVFLPLTAQLLLPLLFSGFISMAVSVSLFSKYSESAEAGALGTKPGARKCVALGTIGSALSTTEGYSFARSVLLKMLLALVISKSLSAPARSKAMYL